MNGNEFLDKMELVDEKYIEQADKPVKKSSGRILFRLCAMAACCALALTLGIRALLQNDTLPVQPESPAPPASGSAPGSSLPPAPPQPPKELPSYPELLALPAADSPTPAPFEWPELAFGAMGYEGYWLKDISELQTGNPWKPEMNFGTLPVYRNAVLYDREQLAQNVDFDVMEELLLAVASRMGLDAETIEIRDNAATEEQKQEIRAKHKECGLDPPDEASFAPTYVYCEAQGVRIEVRTDHDVRIQFETPRSYPKDVLSAAPGLELLEKKSAYLMAQYADLLCMEQPSPAVHTEDYNSTSDQNYTMNFYDAAGSGLEKILRYNFYPARFCDDDNGELFLIWLDFPDLTNLLGDYPAITPQQAQQELLAGRYVTSVPYDGFTAEEVAAVELVYRAESYDPVYVPYYKFYVDITDQPEHYTADSMKGMREYGAYYVPAIAPEYLACAPLWDGHIN